MSFAFGLLGLVYIAALMKMERTRQATLPSSAGFQISR